MECRVFFVFFFEVSMEEFWAFLLRTSLHTSNVKERLRVKIIPPNLINRTGPQLLLIRTIYVAALLNGYDVHFSSTRVLCHSMDMTFYYNYGVSL